MKNKIWRYNMHLGLPKTLPPTSRNYSFSRQFNSTRSKAPEYGLYHTSSEFRNKGWRFEEIYKGRIFCSGRKSCRDDHRQWTGIRHPKPSIPSNAFLRQYYSPTNIVDNNQILSYNEDVLHNRVGGRTQRHTKYTWKKRIAKSASCQNGRKRFWLFPMEPKQTSPRPEAAMPKCQMLFTKKQCWQSSNFVIQWKCAS